MNAIVTSLEVGGNRRPDRAALRPRRSDGHSRVAGARLILSLVLLPLFIPRSERRPRDGALFHLIGIPPSLVAIAIVQAVWALPFATIVILVAMTAFDPVYLEAAWMSGASRLRGSSTSNCRLFARGSSEPRHSR